MARIIIITVFQLLIVSYAYSGNAIPRAWINGYFGYANPGQTPADKEYDLNRYAKGECRKLTRIPGNGTGKTFANLCAEVGKTCSHVLDWHKDEWTCGERADDGSRMALCIGNFQNGHYAWHDTRTQQDRESELKRIAGNVYYRLKGQIGGQFNSVCESIDMSCSHVKDWRDHNKSCNARADDGSRSAYCVGPSVPPTCN